VTITSSAGAVRWRRWSRAVAALGVGGEGGAGAQGRAMARPGGAGSRAMAALGAGRWRGQAAAREAPGLGHGESAAYGSRTLVARQRRRKEVLYKSNIFFGLKPPRIQATNALTGGVGRSTGAIAPPRSTDMMTLL
jgi:hypothetical protein